MQMDENSKIPLGQIARIFGQIHVKSSVLNPLLWLSGVIAFLFLLAAYFMPLYAGVLICVAILPVLFALIAYVYFALRDPTRLQSEEYQIKHQQIQQMMQGANAPRVIVEGQLVPNPALEGQDRAEEGRVS